MGGLRLSAPFLCRCVHFILELTKQNKTYIKTYNTNNVIKHCTPHTHSQYRHTYMHAHTHTYTHATIIHLNYCVDIVMFDSYFQVPLMHKRLWSPSVSWVSLWIWQRPNDCCSGKAGLSKCNSCGHLMNLSWRSAWTQAQQEPEAQRVWGWTRVQSSAIFVPCALRLF